MLPYFPKVNYIIYINKEYNMHINVTKWGTSLGLRIPNILAKKIGIHEGTPVDVSIQGNRLVITKEISLQSLLSQVSSENIHTEVQLGAACGKESW
jgi:antitoxin MazE